MAFLDTFRRTQRGSAGPAAISKWLDRPIEAGVYEDGLLVLLSDEATWDDLQSWPTLAQNKNLRSVAYTGLGDVFLADDATGEVFLLSVQEQSLPRAAPDCRLLLDAVLVRPRVVEQVLQRPRVNELVGRLGPLEYLQCFILQPWLMLGGEDVADNYVKGDVRTYVNLVGQSAFSS
jgi:hypothetical protein